MIFIYLTLSYSTILGIDLGSSYLKSSILSKDTPLHFAINSHSQRLTPNYFAFWNRTKASNYTSVTNWDESASNDFEFAFGRMARDQCLRFPKLCLKGFNYLSNDTYFNLRGYEIAALSLKSYIDSIAEAEKINDTIQLVISLPPMMNPRSKSFLYAALSSINIEVLQFIDSTTSPAYVYGFERYKGEDNKIVSFVDVGAKGTRVSIFTFDNSTGTTNITEVSVAFNESLGGNNIDSLLGAKLAKIHNVHLDNPKTRVNFLDDISMVKEMLSNYPSVDLKFEDDEDDEKIITVTRKDLDEIGEALVPDIEKLIQSAIRKSKIDLKDKNITVEMIGGCSRINFIEEATKKAFNISKLSHTLNPDSAIAFGAGYAGAEKSPQFILKNLSKTFLLTQPIILKTDHSIYKMFEIGDNEDSNPVVQVTVHPNQKFVIATGNTMNPYMEFVLTNLTKQNTNIDISFIHNYFLMPVPFKAVLSKTTTSIGFSYLNVGWEVPTDDLIRSGEKVLSLISLQKLRREKEVAVNLYQSELFRVKNFLEEAKNITDKERHLIEEITKEGIEWFENMTVAEEIKVPVEVYKKRHQELLERTTEIVERGTEYLKKPKMFEKIQKTIKKAKNYLEQSNSLEDCNVTLKDALKNSIKETENWLQQVSEQIESITSKELEKRRTNLKKVLIPLKQNIKSIQKKKEVKKEKEPYDAL